MFIALYCLSLALETFEVMKQLNIFRVKIPFTISLMVLFIWLIGKSDSSASPPSDADVSDLNLLTHFYEDTTDCNAKNTNECVNYLSEKASELFSKNPNEAYSIGEQLVFLGETNNLEICIAKGKEVIARASMNKTVNVSSFRMAKEALDYALKIKADTVYLDCIDILGLGYFRKKEYHKVFQYNQMGLDFAKKANIEDRRLRFTTNAGLILLKVGDYDKALKYFDEALNLSTTNKESIQWAKLHMNKADLFYYQKKYDLAEKEISTSLQVLDGFDNQLIETEANLILGKISFKKGDLLDAKIYYDKADKLLVNWQDYKRLADVNLGFSGIALKNKKLREAEKYALIANKYSNTSSYNNGKLESSKLLHQINSHLKNYELASKYLLTHTHLLDSLEVAENQTKVKIKLVEMNLKQKQDQAKAEERINTRRQNFILYATVFLLLMGITLIIMQNERKQRVLNKSLYLSKMELEKQSLILSQSNDDKSKLFSIISHDLKGPMSSFKELVKMYNRGVISKQEIDMFAPQFENKIDGILLTLNNLLTWGKNQMGGIKTEPVNINLHDLATTNISLLSEIAQKKSIELVNQLSVKSDAWADRDQIDIVIRNLLSNAIKFTKENGVITIYASNMNDKWQVCVQDSGIDMNEETVTRIFNNDSSFTTYGTKGEKGTGLGLMVCKEMVLNNKGDIWVDSKVGSGSNFYFTIPKYSNQNLS